MLLFHVCKGIFLRWMTRKNHETLRNFVFSYFLNIAKLPSYVRYQCIPTRSIWYSFVSIFCTIFSIVRLQFSPGGTACFNSYYLCNYWCRICLLICSRHWNFLLFWNACWGILSILLLYCFSYRFVGIDYIFRISILCHFICFVNSVYGLLLMCLWCNLHT